MIFLDTSFLISLEIDSDTNHSRAVKLNRKIAKGLFGKLVISDYIFDETVTVTFGRTRKLAKAVLAGDSLFESAEIMTVDEKIFKDSWKFFKSQKSTRLSFTDCTTVVMMQANGIRNIATFDEDFKNIGSVRIVA
jgi:predicted nucleic acid-binding protein